MLNNQLFFFLKMNEIRKEDRCAINEPFYSSSLHLHGVRSDQRHVIERIFFVVNVKFLG